MFRKLIKNKDKNNKDVYVAPIEAVDLKHVPNHVAIIMDGNGRWAQKRGLPRMAGHHEGMKTVKKIVKTANKVGVKILTLYAFSTENWKRPKMEVDYLMRLPSEFLNDFLPELQEENVKVIVMGNKNLLPQHTINSLDEAIKSTANNDGLVLNFALNYGSRDEILKGIKKVLKDHQDGKISTEDITEQTFSNYLMTSELDEPDLLIRTSGEKRVSNFMLWQIAYAEFLFTDVLWPDYEEEHFLGAIVEYQNRGRRFGGI